MNTQCREPRWLRWGPVIALVGLAGRTGAAEVSLQLDLWSRYVFRGQTYSDGAVFQPALTVSTGPWSWTTWANLDLSDANSSADREVQWRFTEVDIYLNWSSPSWGPCSVGLGLGTYAVAEPPPASGDTTEICAWYRFDPSGLDTAPSWTREMPSITLSAFYELLEYEDWYASVELGRTVPVCASWELTGYARLGYAGGEYNRYFFGTDENSDQVDSPAWSDLTLRAEVTYACTKACKVAALAEYGRFLDDDVRAGARAVFGRGEWRAFGLRVRYDF